MLKIGLGLDSHRLISKTISPNPKNLILGGFTVSQDFYFDSDSDGDVVLHSLCNAFSSSLGSGSLNTWAGPMCKDGITDSRLYLTKIISILKDQNLSISNVSIAVEGSQPKLETFRDDIKTSLSSILEIPTNNIGITFTSGQDLTSFGLGQGIQATSIVLIFQNDL
ncbi:MAG: 2-C-methyl-D-erythritol 2,4-cyclodiphosphate synthase [Candidatus Shapirobacteria bacterium]|nr:2-C-methyl-D-erythritol 2,4-cyclodiphosphate synthase [Candidatus Shapirobacteria bacterium]